VKSMRQSTLSDGSAVVQIELSSNREFLPRGELLVLQIGDAEFASIQYAATGETGTVTFTLTAEEFASLADSAAMSIQYGLGHNDPGWKFGRLNKGQLSK